MRVELHRSKDMKWYFIFHDREPIVVSEMYENKQGAFTGMFAVVDTAFEAAGYEIPQEMELEYFDMTLADEIENRRVKVKRNDISSTSEASGIAEY